MNNHVPTQCRDAEFERILSELEAARPCAGGGVPQICLLSVVAPREGGLTGFLTDLCSRVEARGMIALFDTFEGGLDRSEVREVFRRIGEAAAQRAGHKANEYFGLEGLFAHANSLAVANELVVLVLDAAEAIRDIVGNAAQYGPGTRPALLDELRFLANALQDQRPNLAVVVGWDDEFQQQSAVLGALDVVQRYPSVDLWPDFGELGWRGYAQVLAQHGFRVGGDFPGFARSGIAVGRLIRFMRQSRHEEATGDVLLDMLASDSSEIQGLVQQFPRPALVKLCLEDGEIKHGDALYEHTQSEPLQSLVELSSSRGYVASEELYQSLHLQPAHVILSLDKSVRRRYVENPDRDLAVEVCRGIVSALDRGSAYTEDSRARAVSIPTQGLKHSVTDDLHLHLVVELGSDLSETLQSDLVQKLSALEPSERASHLIVVVHRESLQAEAQFGGILKHADRQGIELPDLPPKVRNLSRVPERLVSVSLNADHVVDAVRRARDPGYDATRLSEHLQSAIDGGLRRIHGCRPPLRARSFKGGVLAHLVGHCGQAFSRDDMKSHLADLEKDKRVVGKCLDELTAIGCLQKEKASYTWRFSGDSLVRLLKDGGDEDLTQAYTFFGRDWVEIAAAIAEAYGDHYLLLKEENLEVTDGLAGHRERAESLLSQCRDRLGFLLEIPGSGMQEGLERTARLSSRLRGAVALESVEAVCGELLEQLARVDGRLKEQEELKCGLHRNLNALRDRCGKLEELDEMLERKRDSLQEAIDGHLLEGGELGALMAQVPQIEKDVEALEAAHVRLMVLRDHIMGSSAKLKPFLAKLQELSEKCKAYSSFPMARELASSLADQTTELRALIQQIGAVAAPRERESSVNLQNLHEQVMIMLGTLPSSVLNYAQMLSKFDSRQRTESIPEGSDVTGQRVQETREPPSTVDVGKTDVIRETPRSAPTAPASESNQPTAQTATSYIDPKRPPVDPGRESYSGGVQRPSGPASTIDAQPGPTGEAPPVSPPEPVPSEGGSPGQGGTRTKRLRRTFSWTELDEIVKLLSDPRVEILSSEVEPGHE